MKPLFWFWFWNIYWHNIRLPVKLIRCCFWYCFDLALSCQTISLSIQKPGPISQNAKGLYIKSSCVSFSFLPCVLSSKKFQNMLTSSQVVEWICGKTSTQFQMYLHHIVLIDVQYCLWEKNRETCLLVCQLWDKNDHFMYLLYVIFSLQHYCFWIMPYSPILVT